MARAPSRTRRSDTEERLRALDQGVGDGASPQARALLREALASTDSLVVARAARLVQEHVCEGLTEPLAAAFERFVRDGVKTDPGCHAKLALLEVLDRQDSVASAPFLRAMRHVQKEPAWGKPVDTAATLRARGAAALARLGHRDFLLWMAELLSDPEVPPRVAAAEALGHRGDPAGAALLVLALGRGDEEPLVTLECMRALLSLAPEWGAQTLGARLEGEDPAARELAALALGQSSRADALTLLLDALGRAVEPSARESLLRGLGQHRSERALEALLHALREGAARDARSALGALDAWRFRHGVEQRVREAVALNPSAGALREALEKAFAESE